MSRESDLFSINERRKDSHAILHVTKISLQTRFTSKQHTSLYTLIYGLCITRDALPLVCLIHAEIPRVHLVQNLGNSCSRKPFRHRED